MPCNVPAWNGQNIRAHLDEIIIFSKNETYQIEHVKKVLNVLIEENLHVNCSKSMFLKEEIKYLGYIISKDGIKCNPDKIEAINKWKAPTSKDELRSFLGTVYFLHKH